MFIITKKKRAKLSSDIRDFIDYLYRQLNYETSGKKAKWKGEGGGGEIDREIPYMKIIILVVSELKMSSEWWWW